jgi:2-polyprenyl-3-methyl-5-hydroxy-6-metoxy-1,4-benzoquinol methylase
VTSEPEPKPHRVVWTPEKIARFWKWWPDALPAQERFAAHSSDPVLRFVRDTTGLSPPAVVADVGAGGGDLLDRLLGQGFECVGFELSQESVDELHARLGHRSGFRGGRVGGGEALPADDGEFDAVLALEVIEHLLDDQVGPFFAEAARVLRADGIFALSTPNAERLEAAHILCPDCGGVFHPVQHLQTWDAERLQSTARNHGFEPIATEATRLFSSRLEASLAGAANVVKRGLGLRKEPLRPNLLFACRRSA